MGHPSVPIFFPSHTHGPTYYVERRCKASLKQKEVSRMTKCIFTRFSFSPFCFLWTFLRSVFPLSQVCGPFLRCLQQFGPCHSLPARAPATECSVVSTHGLLLWPWESTLPVADRQNEGLSRFCIILGSPGVCRMVYIITAQVTKHLKDRMPAPQDPDSTRCSAGRAAWHDTRKVSPVNTMFSQA